MRNKTNLSEEEINTIWRETIKKDDYDIIDATFTSDYFITVYKLNQVPLKITTCGCSDEVIVKAEYLED